MTQQGMTEDALRPMEYFFYAPSMDAASNLIISLHELGYKVYKSGPPCDAAQHCVSGHTPMMSTIVKVIAEWYEAMSELAEVHNCVFDGYGTLITEPEEGWD